MATDPITPPKPAGAGAAKGETKFQTWLRTHQKQALLGLGAAGAVGIALWRRHTANTSTGAASSTGVPADATTAGSDSAGGIPGSYAPYGGDGGGYYGGDSGPATGTDAVGLLNALGGVLGDLPAPAPTPAAAKFTPTKTTTTRTLKVNPPGKHNTTVRTTRTTKVTRRAPKKKKK